MPAIDCSIVTHNESLEVLGEATRLATSRQIDWALVTVVLTVGSTPRHPPAKMVVARNGCAKAGTIGGGRLEADVCAAAAPIASGAGPARRLHYVTQHLGMCCGGELDVWIEPLDGARVETLVEVVRRVTQRLPTALATRLGPPGGKEILTEDPCLNCRVPRLEGDCFVEPVLPPDRVILFGCGHVARAVAAIAATVGFNVVACDDDELLTGERFPNAHRVDSLDVGEVLRAVGPFGRGDHAIIATRDHGLDQTVLEQLVMHGELTSLGMLGSRGKRERFRARLQARGVGTESDWTRLRCPIGIDILAETPEEIAVSVVAELVRLRRVV